MNEFQLPAVIYEDLNKLAEKYEIEIALNATFEQLDRGHIASIINAFFQNTKICVNGIPYIKVKGLSSILRTGGSKAERPLIYQGMAGVFSPSIIIQIGGEDHVSGPSLVAALHARMHFNSGKTYQYLIYASEIYRRIINLAQVRDFKDMFLANINECRPQLKRERIEKHGISCCEFSGTQFTSLDGVEFAHIDSVATNPSQALNINNGVIILRQIHADLTRNHIHDLAGMYQYCINNNYSTEWAKFIA